MELINNFFVGFVLIGLWLLITILALSVDAYVDWSNARYAKKAGK